jgi:hypothetical protein
MMGQDLSNGPCLVSYVDFPAAAYFFRLASSSSLSVEAGNSASIAPGRPFRAASTARNIWPIVLLGHRISEKIERIGRGVLGPVALMHETAVRSTPKQVNARSKKASPTRHLQRHRTHTGDDDEDAGRDAGTNVVCTHRPPVSSTTIDLPRTAANPWWVVILLLHVIMEHTFHTALDCSTLLNSHDRLIAN